MTRAGVLLTAVLAAASLGLYAEQHSRSAASPSAASSTAAVSQTGSQTSSSIPGGAERGDPHSSAQSAPAARDSSGNATTAGPNRAIEGSASNDPATPDGQLPQTSTILPLLGLIGLGSLVAGLFARR